MKLTKEDLLVAAEAAEKWPKGKSFIAWTIDEDLYDPDKRKNCVPGIGCPAACVGARKKGKLADLQDEALDLLDNLYIEKYLSTFTIDNPKVVAKRFRKLAETL